MSEEKNQQRLKIATQIAQGLLASQNPEKGWNLDTLSILALKIADNLMHFNSMEKLPELISANQNKEEK
jgi:hypothetical protein